MLVLGLLLIVLSVAATVLLVAYNGTGGPEQMIVLFGRDLVSVTPLQAFLAGIVAALLFCLGLWMVVSTNRRRREATAEFRAARREAREAAAERDRLAKELERSREQERTAPADTSVADRTPPERGRAPAHRTSGPRGLGQRFRRRSRRTEEVSNEQPANG